jgi:hypothetical protein
MIAASYSRPPLKSYGALVTSLAIGVLLAHHSPAAAVSSKVRSACAGDYLSYCSSYAPDSAETRRCMRSVGFKLSRGCIDALVATGMVSRAEVARRSASRR